MKKDNAVLEFIETYYSDPVGFAKNILGLELDPWQAEVLTEYAKGTRKISARSGHGVGKTCVASIALLHHMLTRFPQKSICTAPTGSQLFDALFSELKAWIERLPDSLRSLIEHKVDRVTLKDAPHESFISAKTSRIEQPDALQGVHSEHVMLVVDEASAIPEAIYEAAYSSMSAENAIIILLGNPTRGVGYFYDTFHRLSNDWHNIHINCKMSKRVAKDFVEEMEERYGAESNVFRTRVLGEFPKSEDDTFISLELVQGAIGRDVKPNPNHSIVWGLDVARFGEDSSCLVKRKQNVLLDTPKIWRRLDLMDLCGHIMSEYQETPENEKPVDICVDAIGLGAGVADRLLELGLPVRSVNVSESPAMGVNKYQNLRAELWGKAKDWLEKRDCNLPEDRRLIADLTVPKYNFTSNGKIKIESKSDMKKRGIKSPDVADAFCLTFASDSDYASGSTRLPWSQAIGRKIRGMV